jgi:uncharacterized membrane protein YeaQ/YmgE (transglycosylase-associated protein family)
MHPFDIIIAISIACCVGFVPAIYVNKDLLLAIGYFVGSTVGSFAGSFLSLWFFPEFDKLGIVLGGLIGAILLVVIWHLARKSRDQVIFAQPQRPRSGRQE